MPRIERRGFATYYQQTGSGPDVVLIHAFTSNLSMWVLTGIAEALAQNLGLRVTSYDMRGHGATYVTPSGYDSATLADDLAALMEAWQMPAAIVVGHSYGGVVAMHTAVRHPDRVRGVIVADSYFPGLSAIEPSMPHAEPWRDLQRTLSRAGIEIGDQVDFSRLFALIQDLTADQWEALDPILGPSGTRWLGHLKPLATTTAGHEAFEAAGLTADILRTIRQPVVGLYDEHSAFLRTSAFLQDELPSCCVDLVPGAHHLAPLDNTAAFLPLLEKHLARLTTAAGIAGSEYDRPRMA